MKSLRVLGSAIGMVVAATFLLAQEAAAQNKTLAWIPKATNSTFWLAVKRGAEKAGEELGYDILYVGVQDQTNIAGQVNLVNDMVVRKVDGILIAATDAKALAPAVEQAIERGVPVITLDSGVDSDAPYAYIATDNIGAARIAAETLAELVGGKGKVGDIGITAGSQTGREREQGFLEGMQKYPEIEVLPVQYSGCDPAKSLNVATDFYTANPDLVGLLRRLRRRRHRLRPAGQAEGPEGQGPRGVVRHLARGAAAVQGRLHRRADRPGPVSDGLPRRACDGQGSQGREGGAQSRGDPGAGRD